MFNQSLLKSLAGSASYKRGEKLFALGAVKIVKLDDSSVTAKVKGTNIYSVSLLNSGDDIIASCNCMAFDMSGFCKHCVALGLTVNHPELVDESNVVISDEQKLKDYLQSFDKDKLADTLYKLIIDDEHLTQNWLLKAELANKPVNDKDLKKLITKAFPKRQMWEYSKVSRYFDNASAVFDIITSQLESATPEQRFKILLQCLDRLNVVISGIDDSGGYRLDVEESLCNAIYKTFAQVNWSAIEKANWLYLQFNKMQDISLDVPGGFNLNDEDKVAFLLVCQQAFDDVEVSNNINERQWDHKLLWLGENLLSGDVKLHQKIKILQKMATRIDDLLKISTLCLQNDDELTAEDWLLKAKPLIRTKGDKLIWTKQASAVALANDELKLAWDFSWQKFELSPSFEAYIELITMANKTGQVTKQLETDVEARLLALYEGRGYQFDELKLAWDFAWQKFELSPSFDVYIELMTMANKTGQVTKQLETDVEARLLALYEGRGYQFDDVVAYYLHHKQLAQAIAWCEGHKVSPATLLTLADSIMLTHGDKANKFYFRSLDLKLATANNRTYEDVVKYLAKVERKWPFGSQYQKHFLSLLLSIKQKHKAKRNLMALMNQRFSDYMLLLD